MRQPPADAPCCDRVVTCYILAHPCRYITQVKNLQRVLEGVAKETPQALAAREQRIASLRESHFSAAGAMKQIHKFMLEGEGAGAIRGRGGTASAAATTASAVVATRARSCQRGGATRGREVGQAGGD